MYKKMLINCLFLIYIAAGFGSGNCTSAEQAAEKYIGVYQQYFKDKAPMIGIDKEHKAPAHDYLITMLESFVDQGLIDAAGYISSKNIREYILKKTNEATSNTWFYKSVNYSMLKHTSFGVKQQT